MHDDIVIRWQVDHGERVTGEVRLLRIDWDMARPAEQLRMIREEVGGAVMDAIGVEWRVANADVDEPR